MNVEGTVLAGPELEPTRGRVVEECETDADDVVFPAFVNAHTHVGDAVAEKAGEAGRPAGRKLTAASPTSFRGRSERRAGYNAHIGC